jgi:hypothetical protein
MGDAVISVMTLKATTSTRAVIGSGFAQSRELSKVEQIVVQHKAFNVISSDGSELDYGSDSNSGESVTTIWMVDSGTFVTSSTYGFGIGTGFARDGGKTSTVELSVISGGIFLTTSSLAPVIGARQRSLSGRSILPRRLIHGAVSIFAFSVFGNWNRI